MSKNQVIIALVVLCLVGTIWGSIQDKKSSNLERQLAAMKEQPVVAPVVDESALSDAQAITTNALKEIADLKSQNQALLANAATLKGSVASLKKEIAESDKGSEAVAVVQAQLDKKTADITHLEEVVAVAKSELAQKNTELATAAEFIAGFEDVKSSLANSVDAYNTRSQELSAEVEAYGMRILSLEKALEDRTKLLVDAGEDLARTKLNMNVLLSKIAAQNNSLAILEETRVALEKELALKFRVVEELQQQLSEQAIEEVIIVAEMPAMEEAETEEVPSEETATDEAPVEEVGESKAEETSAQ